jgi:hypothetical protein
VEAAIAILRDAPSGIGASGLESVFRAKYGTLRGLRAIEENPDAQDV